MFPLPCVIFAGGKSSRMGEDKSLLPFGGFSTLAEFQYHRLLKLFSHVYISTKTANKFDFDAPFILDSDTAAFAPTAGFISTFEKLGCDCFFALSVDSPFVGETEILRLLDEDSSDRDAVIAKTISGSHPLCGIYHRSLLGEFLRMAQENDHRLGKLLAMSKTSYVEFENEEPFMNLNHPNEYKEALLRLNEFQE